MRRNFLTQKPFKETISVVGSYCGYDIIRITRGYYFYNRLAGAYDKRYIQDVRDFYDFCPTGLVSCTSKRYMCGSTDIDNVKHLIDLHINGGRVIFTYGEFNKWVVTPNHKHDWGFNDKMLYAIIREYKKASTRRRAGYVERLDDANFHTYADLLEHEKFDELTELIKKEWG